MIEIYLQDMLDTTESNSSEKHINAHSRVGESHIKIYIYIMHRNKNACSLKVSTATLQSGMQYWIKVPHSTEPVPPVKTKI